MNSIDQFKTAYLQNGKIFARHCDLINLLGWTQQKYIQVLRGLVKSYQWILEPGYHNADKPGDFAVRKSTGLVCFSVRFNRLKN